MSGSIYHKNWIQRIKLKIKGTNTYPLDHVGQLRFEIFA